MRFAYLTLSAALITLPHAAAWSDETLVSLKGDPQSIVWQRDAKGCVYATTKDHALQVMQEFTPESKATDYYSIHRTLIDACNNAGQRIDGQHAQLMLERLSKQRNGAVTTHWKRDGAYDNWDLNGLGTGVLNKRDGASNHGIIVNESTGSTLIDYRESAGEEAFLASSPDNEHYFAFSSAPEAGYPKEITDIASGYLISILHPSSADPVKFVYALIDTNKVAHGSFVPRHWDIIATPSENAHARYDLDGYWSQSDAAAPLVNASFSFFSADAMQHVLVENKTTLPEGMRVCAFQKGTAAKPVIDTAACDIKAVK